MESKSISPLYAVVVWYNPGKKEAEAVTLYSPYVEKVVVVDNSENDNSHLLNRIDNAIYLPQHNNSGIAAALNTGCEYVYKAGGEWVLTMDQDSRWDQTPFETYIKTAEQYDEFDKVAIFCPFHDTDGEPLKHQRHHHKEDYEICRIVICSGNLLRLKAWKEAGGFREDFFIDCVDDEICCHLRKNGWRIMSLNRIILTHTLGNGITKVPILGHSYTSHTAWRYFYIARNIRRMMRLYPDMRPYYRSEVRKHLKRLWLYDWDNKFGKLRQFHRGWFAQRQDR